MRRTLLRWACFFGWRELIRCKRVPAESRAGLIVLAAIPIAPAVTLTSSAAYVWWLATGKRLPGRLGKWLGPPSRFGMSAYPKQVVEMPPDIRSVFPNDDSAS